MIKSILTDFFHVVNGFALFFKFLHNVKRSVLSLIFNRCKIKFRNKRESEQMVFIVYTKGNVRNKKGHNKEI